MNKNNQSLTHTLTLKTGFKSAREVCEAIRDLSAKFRIHFRRGETVDLVYSEAGTLKEPLHNMAVWADPFDQGQIKEVKYFQEVLATEQK